MWRDQNNVHHRSDRRCVCLREVSGNAVVLWQYLYISPVKAHHQAESPKKTYITRIQQLRWWYLPTEDLCYLNPAGAFCAFLGEHAVGVDTLSDTNSFCTRKNDICNKSQRVGQSLPAIFRFIKLLVSRISHYLVLSVPTRNSGYQQPEVLIQQTRVVELCWSEVMKVVEIQLFRSTVRSRISPNNWREITYSCRLYVQMLYI